MNELSTREYLFWDAAKSSVVGRYWREHNYVQIAYERLSLISWMPWGPVSSKTLQSIQLQLLTPNLTRVAGTGAYTASDKRPAR